MDFKFDDFYSIGTGHVVCEDYSYSGLLGKGYPCVIISDGCSSSNDTDVGARLITHAIKARLTSMDLGYMISQDNYIETWFIPELIYRLQDKISTMKLDITALDATFRLATIVNNKIVMIHFGDGYSVLKNHTTGETVKQLYTKYESNAPYYYPYHVIPNSKENYMTLFADKSIECDGKTYGVFDYVNSIDNFYSIIDLDDLDDGEYSISVMSDGIDTFYKDGLRIDTDKMIDEMLSFKNTNGEFVKRRVRKCLFQNVKKGIKYFDDISVASIIFKVGEDETENSSS